MDGKDICNLGLGKIGASRVSNIVSPRSPTETHCARGYKQWVKSELTKRRWVFSRSFRTLTAVLGVDTTAERPYVYSLPEDFIRPIKWKSDEWQRRGRYIHSAISPFTLEYHALVAEDDFDPLFVDVMACRVALESTEFLTQSNVKFANIQGWYDQAIRDAGRMNAYELGPEDITTEEIDNDWERARQGVGL